MYVTGNVLNILRTGKQNIGINNLWGKGVYNYNICDKN